MKKRIAGKRRAERKSKWLVSEGKEEANRENEECTGAGEGRVWLTEPGKEKRGKNCSLLSEHLRTDGRGMSLPYPWLLLVKYVIPLFSRLLTFNSSFEELFVSLDSSQTIEPLTSLNLFVSSTSYQWIIVA